MKTTDQIFAQCVNCDHVWPIARLPVSVRKLVRACEYTICPECNSGALLLSEPGRKPKKQK